METVKSKFTAQDLYYLKHKPLSEKGKAVRQLLLKEIVEDDEMFRHFKSTLRKSDVKTHECLKIILDRPDLLMECAGQGDIDIPDSEQFVEEVALICVWARSFLSKLTIATEVPKEDPGQHHKHRNLRCRDSFVQKEKSMSNLSSLSGVVRQASSIVLSSISYDENFGSTFMRNASQSVDSLTRMTGRNGLQRSQPSFFKTHSTSANANWSISKTSISISAPGRRNVGQEKASRNKNDVNMFLDNLPHSRKFGCASSPSFCIPEADLSNDSLILEDFPNSHGRQMVESLLEDFPLKSSDD